MSSGYGQSPSHGYFDKVLQAERAGSFKIVKHVQKLEDAKSTEMGNIENLQCCQGTGMKRMNHSSNPVSSWSLGFLG